MTPNDAWGSLYDLIGRIPDAVTGFFGSITALFANRRLDRWESLGVMVAGPSAAYFLTPYVSDMLPLHPGVRDITAWALGVLAMPLAARAIVYIRDGKLPFVGKKP